jgi:hypothetical protein
MPYLTSKSEGFNVAFLLGSGVSFSVLKLSGELNKLVLNGRASDGRVVTRGSESLYRLVHPSNVEPLSDQWTPRVKTFLGWLVEWLRPDRHDYESLFFACQQLDDDLSGEYENPLLRPFVESCAQRAADWWGDDPVFEFTGPEPPLRMVHALARESRNYIAGAVASALEFDGEMQEPIHSPLLHACADSGVGFIDIITLNHDALLERSFKTANVGVEDGFGQAHDMDGVEQWNGYRMEQPPRIRLVKLHGSIDWWEISREARRRLVRGVGYPFRIRDRFEQYWDTPDQRPRILVGTTNKMLDYLQPFNLDRLAVFRRSLLRCHGLVVAGYGFGDKGVNTMLVEWCHTRNQRLAVIDPCMEQGPAKNARSAIKRMWPRLTAAKRLLPIEEPFSSVEWPRVARFLRDGRES